MGRQVALRAVLIAFMGGVWLGDYFNWCWFWVACGLVVAVFVVLFKVDFVGRYAGVGAGSGACEAGLARFVRNFVRGNFKTIFIVIGVFLFGVGRFLISQPVFNRADVAFYRDLPMNVVVTGRVVGEPDVRSDKIYLVVEAERLRVGAGANSASASDSPGGTTTGGDLPVHGKILLKLDRYPEYFFGDYLKITGKLLTPATFESFDYAGFLGKDQIFVVSYNARVHLVNRPGGINEWSLLYGFKSLLLQKINQLFGEPEASLVAGILIGIRRSIPQKIINDFNRTGLSHILAISGYNITLLINVFGMLLKRRSRPVRFYFTLLGILFFSVLTGLSASVIRAALMGSLAFFALHSGYRSGGLNVLLLSGAAMVFFNPQILANDMSFQLSFSATLGLLIFIPLWEDYFSRLPPFLGEGLVVTLAAQVFATPIILNAFGRFSLIAPLANVFILPMVPVIMLISFLAIVGGFLYFPLNILLIGCCWLIIEIILKGVAFMASFPLASIEIGWFSKPLMLIYYFLVILFLFKKRLLQMVGQRLVGR